MEVASGGVVVGLVVELVALAVVISEATVLKHTTRMVARTTDMFQRNLMLTMIIPRMLNVLLTMIISRMLNVLRMITGRTEFQSCLMLTMLMSITMTLFQKNLALPTVMLKVKRMHRGLFEEESLNATYHVGRVALRFLQCKTMSKCKVSLSSYVVLAAPMFAELSEVFFVYYVSDLRMKMLHQMQTWGNTILKLQIRNLNKLFQ